MGSILMNTIGKEMNILDKQTKDILVAILELENKSLKSWQDETVEKSLMSIFIKILPISNFMGSISHFY